MRRRYGVTLLGVICFALIGALSSRAPLVHAQTGCTTDPLLCELARRLLLPSPLLTGDQPVTVDLLPGALPPDSPLELKIPDGSRLVGSVVDRLNGTFQRVTVVFDSPLSVAETAAYYDDAEAQAGLDPLDASGFAGVGGFQPTSRTDGREFCDGRTGPDLRIFASPGANGQTDARLSVDARDQNNCVVFSHIRGLLPSPPSVRLPRLVAPPGVTVTLPASGESGGSNVTILNGPGSSQRTAAPVQSIAYAATDMSVADLEATYDRQLQAAGWIRTAGDASGPFAWTAYDVLGANGGRGLLYVIDGPGQGQRTLHVELATPAP